MTELWEARNAWLTAVEYYDKIAPFMAWLDKKLDLAKIPTDSSGRFFRQSYRYDALGNIRAIMKHIGAICEPTGGPGTEAARRRALRREAAPHRQ